MIGPFPCRLQTRQTNLTVPRNRRPSLDVEVKAPKKQTQSVRFRGPRKSHQGFGARHPAVHRSARRHGQIQRAARQRRRDAGGRRPAGVIERRADSIRRRAHHRHGGPFAETKELVAGFWIVQGNSKEEIVERFVHAPLRRWTNRFVPVALVILPPSSNTALHSTPPWHRAESCRRSSLGDCGCW